MASLRYACTRAVRTKLKDHPVAGPAETGEITLDEVLNVDAQTACDLIKQIESRYNLEIDSLSVRDATKIEAIRWNRGLNDQDRPPSDKEILEFGEGARTLWVDQWEFNIEVRGVRHVTIEELRACGLAVYAMGG